MNIRILEAINYNFYKDKIDEPTFEYLLSLDPTPTKLYSRWLVDKYLKNPEQNREYLESEGINLKFYLGEYDKFKKSNIINSTWTDINKFKIYTTFMEFMEQNHRRFKQDLVDKEIEKKADKNIKILYKDENNLLLIPLSYQASCKYGANTHWCTTSKTYSGHYESYSEQGTLYIHRFFKNGEFANEAYQLYIPNGNSRSLSEVECRDVSDDTVEDIDDTFFRDIPDEIVSDLKEKIEDAGGFAGDKKTYEIMNSYYGEIDNDGVLNGSVSASLYSYSGEDYGEEDSGDETTYSTFKVYKIGKGQEYYSEIEDIYGLEGFSVENGIGIYVEMRSDVMPDDAINNANNKWHQAERSDSYDTYELTHAVTDLLGKDVKYDYLICNQEGLRSDDVFQDMFRDNFEFRHKVETDSGYGYNYIDSYEEVEISMGETTYTIYYQLEYNYSSADNPASTEFQRKKDKQQDLPYGL